MLFIGLLEGTKTMDQAIDTIARLNILNKAIVNLPDDIIIHIYTKILKKYRLHEGKFIKLTDWSISVVCQTGKACWLRGLGLRLKMT